MSDRKPDWSVTIHTPGNVKSEPKASKSIALAAAKAALKAAKAAGTPIFVHVSRLGWMEPSGNGTVRMVPTESEDFGRWEDVYPEG